jgi:hypothetical protein
LPAVVVVEQHGGMHAELLAGLAQRVAALLKLRVELWPVLAELNPMDLARIRGQPLHNAPKLHQHTQPP